MSGEPSRAVLVADIGGTNVRFALVDEDGRPQRVLALRCKDFSSLGEAVRVYFDQIPAKERPTAAAFAVASPVTGDTVTLTNRAWTFSTTGLAAELGLSRLRIINDFTAIALALPHLGPDDVALLGVDGGETRAIGQDARQPLGVLGPGTGLGVSGLVPTSDGWIPLSSEGGHVSLPTVDERQDALLRALRRRFGHVSAERVVSGPGLVNLYRAIAEVDDEAASSLQPPDVVTRARSGSCPLCVEATHQFTRFLGCIAGNLALTLGCLGGVYIAGGVVPKLGSAFDASAFREAFVAKGRFRDYLERVPTMLVLNDVPAFIGLGALARAEPDQPDTRLA